MIFWITTSAIALVIAATLALVLLRSRPAAEPAAAYDLRVYRTQLKDLEADLERGVIAGFKVQTSLQERHCSVAAVKLYPDINGRIRLEGSLASVEIP